MKICKVIFGSFDSEGYFGNYENSCIFWRRLFIRKLQLTSKALKRVQDHPKPTSFDPPNVLNKLSKNPTLTRRCEVNKFNQLHIFLYKYQPRRLPHRIEDTRQGTRRLLQALETLNFFFQISCFFSSFFLIFWL